LRPTDDEALPKKNRVYKDILTFLSAGERHFFLIRSTVRGRWGSNGFFSTPQLFIFGNPFSAAAAAGEGKPNGTSQAAQHTTRTTSIHTRILPIEPDATFSAGRQIDSGETPPLCRRLGPLAGVGLRRRPCRPKYTKSRSSVVKKRGPGQKTPIALCGPVQFATGHLEDVAILPLRDMSDGSSPGRRSARLRRRCPPVGNPGYRIHAYACQTISRGADGCRR